MRKLVRSTTSYYKACTKRHLDEAIRLRSPSTTLQITIELPRPTQQLRSAHLNSTLHSRTRSSETEHEPHLSHKRGSPHIPASPPGHTLWEKTQGFVRFPTTKHLVMYCYGDILLWWCIVAVVYCYGDVLLWWCIVVVVVVVVMYCRGDALLWWCTALLWWGDVLLWWCIVCCDLLLWWCIVLFWWCMVLNFCRDVMLWWCLIVMIDFLLCVFSSHMFRTTELRLLHFLWLSSLLYSFHISTHLTSRLSSHLYYFTLVTSLYSLYISALFTSLLSSHLHSLHISTVLSSHLYSPHISTFFTSLLFSHLYSLRIPILFTSLLSSLVYSLDILKTVRRSLV